MKNKKDTLNSHLVGIDQGTTNTEFGIYDDTGKPKIIPNSDGELKTPSVVHFDPNSKTVLVGISAYNMQLVAPERTVVEFKRDVGTDKVYFEEDGQPITPERCQTELLKYVRQSAIKYFGDDRAASQAVITVPASFGERERQSVKHAAELAGIEVIALLNEPTAAGLAFALNEKQGDRLVVILDFGGGTLDVSLIQYSGGEATVLASNGDKQLGGKDVDEILQQYVVTKFQEMHGFEISSYAHPAEWFTLKEEVVRQKHMLASRTEVRICARFDGKQIVVMVTRSLLAKLIAPLLERIEQLVLETLANAKVSKSDVDLALPVGGSSRLVAFQELIQRLFGADSIVGGQVSPDLAIAEGAVIHAAKLASASGHVIVNNDLQAIPAPTIKHTDVMPHSLGVMVKDRVSGAGFCSVILPKNQPLPCTATKEYASMDDTQTCFHVVVLQGEDGQRAEDCLVVGEKTLILSPRPRSEPSLEVSMGYDINGMVDLHVQDLPSGQVEDLTIDFCAKAKTSN